MKISFQIKLKNYYLIVPLNQVKYANFSYKIICQRTLFSVAITCAVKKKEEWLFCERQLGFYNLQGPQTRLLALSSVTILSMKENCFEHLLHGSLCQLQRINLCSLELPKNPLKSWTNKAITRILCDTIKLLCSGRHFPLHKPTYYSLPNPALLLILVHCSMLSYMASYKHYLTFLKILQVVYIKKYRGKKLGALDFHSLQN